MFVGVGFYIYENLVLKTVYSRMLFYFRFFETTIVLTFMAVIQYGEGRLLLMNFYNFFVN